MWSNLFYLYADLQKLDMVIVLTITSSEYTGMDEGVAVPRMFSHRQWPYNSILPTHSPQKRAMLAA